ncbi:hypothetical protein EBZ38_07960 [bacterium]|nr:hypothetical protein [bacterium]
MKLEVYSVGSKVKLAEDVEGTIVAICIHGDNSVTYECGWWNGRSYDTRWFYKDQLEITINQKTKIGFI